VQYVDPVAIEIEREERWGLPIHKRADLHIFTIVPHSSDRSPDRCSSGKSCVGPVGTTKDGVLGAWPDYDVLQREAQDRKQLSIPYCFECIKKRDYFGEYCRFLRRAKNWALKQKQLQQEVESVF